MVVGDPDDCAKAVQRWVDIGFDQLTFSPTTNTLPTEASSPRWSCSARRSSRSSTRTPCTRRPGTAEAAARRRDAVAGVRRARRLASPVGAVGRRRRARHAQPDRRRRRAPRRGVRADGRAALAGDALRSDGPQVGSIPGRINPLRTMVAINTPYRGRSTGSAPPTTSSRWDCRPRPTGTRSPTSATAACSGTAIPASTITAERCARSAASTGCASLTSRGVLLDVARARGVERLEPGYGITADDLDAAVELAAVDIEPGDVVLVRTGHLQLFKARDRARRTPPATSRASRRHRAVVPRPRRRRRRHRHVRLRGVPVRGRRGAVPGPPARLVDLGLPRARTSTSRRSRPTAPTTAATRSCSRPRRSRSPARCGAPVNPVAVK